MLRLCGGPRHSSRLSWVRSQNYHFRFFQPPDVDLSRAIVSVQLSVRVHGLATIADAALRGKRYQACAQKATRFPARFLPSPKPVLQPSCVFVAASGPVFREGKRARKRFVLHARVQFALNNCVQFVQVHQGGASSVHCWRHLHRHFRQPGQPQNGAHAQDPAQHA